MILVTGGAGFIGSNFILAWLRDHEEPVINLDKLTYAGNLENLVTVSEDSRYRFVLGGIGDSDLVARLLEANKPRAVVNFAAESHVDRSIHGPANFIQTNISDTFNLIEEVRKHWQSLPDQARLDFRFLHVSTDEVFGSLPDGAPPFTETHPYQPNSPYSASKASSDHLVRAYHHTYGLPTLTTHCSNNYGPYHFPEKLIPLMIVNALQGRPLPIYGDGQQVRDWLYVRDHCSAIMTVLSRGNPGETYNIGGNCERTNREIVLEICSLMDKERPKPDGRPYAEQIVHVTDRAGHDRRYAIDASKIQRELGWAPETSFARGLSATLRWYLENPEWVSRVQSGAYREWINLHYKKLERQ